MHRRLLALTVAAGVGTVVGVGAGVIAMARIEATRPPDVPGLLWPDPKPLEAFELIDQRGAVFSLERLVGRWTFLFFGYTHCPDVCPATLAMLATVLRDLERDRQRAGVPNVVFVSVDPARDAPARLGEYVTFFHPDFVASTGTEDALDALTRQLGIFVSRDSPDESGRYLVSHGSAVLLIGPRARLVGVYQAPHDPAAIASSYRRIRDFLEEREARRSAPGASRVEGRG